MHLRHGQVRRLHLDRARLLGARALQRHDDLGRVAVGANEALVRVRVRVRVKGEGEGEGEG